MRTTYAVGLTLNLPLAVKVDLIVPLTSMRFVICSHGNILLRNMQGSRVKIFVGESIHVYVVICCVLRKQIDIAVLL